MEQNNVTTYSSKVSHGLLVMISVMFVWPIIKGINQEILNIKTLMIVGFLCLVYLFILHLFFNTIYTIKKNKLYVKCGFFSYKPIEIETIKEVSFTNSIISSPAPSFDRILIKYGKFEEIILSPSDKFDFAKTLKKINPEIKNNITK